jgi:hypothetical protein
VRITVETLSGRRTKPHLRFHAGKLPCRRTSRPIFFAPPTETPPPTDTPVPPTYTPEPGLDAGARQRHHLSPALLLPTEGSAFNRFFQHSFTRSAIRPRLAY